MPEPLIVARILARVRREHPEAVAVADRILAAAAAAAIEEAGETSGSYLAVTRGQELARARDALLACDAERGTDGVTVLRYIVPAEVMAAALAEVARALGHET